MQKHVGDTFLTTIEWRTPISRYRPKSDILNETPYILIARWIALFLLISMIQSSKGLSSTVFEKKNYICFCHKDDSCVRKGFYICKENEKGLFLTHCFL